MRRSNGEVDDLFSKRSRVVQALYYGVAVAAGTRLASASGGLLGRAAAYQVLPNWMRRETSQRGRPRGAWGEAIALHSRNQRTCRCRRHGWGPCRRRAASRAAWAAGRWGPSSLAQRRSTGSRGATEAMTQSVGAGSGSWDLGSRAAHRIGPQPSKERSHGGAGWCWRWLWLRSLLGAAGTGSAAAMEDSLRPGWARAEDGARSMGGLRRGKRGT